MRDFLASIRLAPIRFRAPRVLLKLAALRRAGLAVRTGAGPDGIKGRQIARNLDSERRSHRQSGRTHRSPGAHSVPLKLENAGLRPSHTRQVWQDASAADCR